MRRLVMWFSGGLILLLMAVGLAFYLAPIGTGEYRTSPDGSYCARATTYIQRRLFLQSREYQAYQIVAGSCEQGNGEVIWRAEYDPLSRPLLDYGSREGQFITWLPASDQAVFMLDTNRTLTIPVP